MEYLDSLNDYRKRSRSAEDVGGSAKSKLAKVYTENTNGLSVNGFGNGHSQQTAVASGIAGVVHMEDDSASMPPESQEVEGDDPTVYGKLTLLFV